MKASRQNNSIRFAALAVDVVCFRVVGGVVQILLGKISSPSNIFKGKWAHIGGLVRVSETAEQSADRLLNDKAGIKNIYKEQLHTFSTIKRDPRGRVVSVAYIALMHESVEQDLKRATLETRWFPISEIPKLAYDHNEITNVAMKRLSARIRYSDIAKFLMADTFTLSDLQTVHESITGDSFDKRNFRKRILSLDVLKSTKKTFKKGVMRPAALYSFK